jgi:hypothetical protein
LQELIGDEIIDETDRWTNNMQTARVNVQRLTETLPSNLRTLLSLGMFMPRINPGRTNRRMTLTSDHTSIGTPFADAAPSVDMDNLEARFSNPPSVAGSVVGQRYTASRTRSSRSFFSEPMAATPASVAPSRDDVAEAVKRVEAHLQSDVEVMDAVDVLRDAVVGAPVPSGSLVCASTSNKTSSFFLSKGGKIHAQQAKDRAAQVKQDLQNHENPN